jgi:hypothetical protein
MLAKVAGEIRVEIDAPVTTTKILDAVEAAHPNLRGTIREHGTLKRRPMIRFYACNEDLSHDSPDMPLPEKIVSGQEPFYVIGAIAGG